MAFVLSNEISYASSFQDHLNQANWNWCVSCKNIWKVWRIHKVDLILTDKVEGVLDLGPVPRISFVLDFEKASILQVHQRDYLLIAVVHDKDPSQVIEILLSEASLREREQAHGPQHLHLIVSFDHFGLQLLSNIFDILTHYAFTFKAVDLQVIDVSLALWNVESDVYMFCCNFLGLDYVHVLEFLDEFV